MNWKFWKDNQRDHKKEAEEMYQYMMITAVEVKGGISSATLTIDGMKKFLYDLDKIPIQNIPNNQKYVYKPIG
jgi:hypothetical protein